MFRNHVSIFVYGLACSCLRSETPQLPPILPQIPTIKDHKGSLGGPGGGLFHLAPVGLVYGLGFSFPIEG